MSLKPNTVRFNISIPAEINNWLANKAASNHRSKNGELISLLEEYMKKDVQASQQLYPSEQR